MARKAGTTSQDTEARIYASALSLFARFGYAAVSMRQIAAEVGVNQAALYHYTPTKQNLLAAVLTRHMMGLIAAWEDEVKPDDPLAALDHFTRFHIRYHMPRPDEIFVSYMELRSLDDDHLSAITSLRRDYENGLRDIIKRGIERGVFETIDPALTAMAILSMLTGITTWYKKRGRLNQRQIENEYSRLALHAVGVDAAKTQALMEDEQCSMPA